MKINVLKMIVIIMIFIVFSLIFSNKVFASEASVSANNCNVGENFTVTINIPQDASGYDIGGITVAYSDGSTQSAKRVVKANMDLSWPGNYTVTFPGKVAGNATISVNGVMLVNSSQAVINSNSTLQTSITISDPTPPPSTSNNPSTTTTPDETTPSTPSTPNTSTTPNTTPKPSDSVTVQFSSTNEKMYTNRRVNVRQNCGTENGIIQTLAVGTEVTRTGVGDKNKNGYSWSRISYNGITGYVITASLTYDAPVTEEVPPEETEEPDTTEDNQDKQEDDDQTQELPDENIDDDKSKIEAISEEFGTIPQVGISIIPFLFLGSCVSCIVIMIEVKRKMVK